MDTLALGVMSAAARPAVEIERGGRDVLALPHPSWILHERGRGTRVHVPDPLARRASRQALDRARRLLGEPRCRSVLTQFADREAHVLADRLDALGVDVQTYLTMIVFMDGTRNRSCLEGVIAFTRPGSRVVYLCINELKRRWQQNPRYVVGAFIHEMLHTLGLGENPPPAQEITRRVPSGESCGFPSSSGPTRNSSGSPGRSPSSPLLRGLPTG